MKRNRVHSAVSILCSLGLVAALALGALFSLPSQASAQAGTPHITVFLKNYQAEYDLATTQFLEQQFHQANSPAYGLVNYTIVTTLTTQSLAGSVALLVDESADMSLTAEEALIIHRFVTEGGRVGFFSYPRHYWDHTGANPAAYQAIADVWGITAIGSPADAELSSGHSSAIVTEAEHGSIAFTAPYSVTEQVVATYDGIPFSPITATAATPLLVSPALGQMPVAVANQHGVFVSTSIGDAVQGGDANTVYAQFVVDAIVWLSTGNGPLLQQHVYLPVILR